MTHYILPLIAILTLTACSGGSGGGKYDDYQEEPEEASIEESPYDEGTGHNAGYVWAQTNGLTDPSECGGDSDSFIQGCQEYVNMLPSSPAAEADPVEEAAPFEDGYR